MKILLDTHIWIWSIAAPQKVGSKLRRQIEDVRNELYLSPVSVWEGQFALRRQIYRMAIPYQKWLEKAFAEYQVAEAPLTFAVATEAAALVLPHPDPGDLFIAATAIVYGLTLATADEQLLACRAVKTISNA